MSHYLMPVEILCAFTAVPKYRFHAHWASSLKATTSINPKPSHTRPTLVAQTHCRLRSILLQSPFLICLNTKNHHIQKKKKKKKPPCADDEHGSAAMRYEGTNDELIHNLALWAREQDGEGGCWQGMASLSLRGQCGVGRGWRGRSLKKKKKKVRTKRGIDVKCTFGV